MAHVYGTGFQDVQNHLLILLNLAHLGTIDISNSSYAEYESHFLRDEQFSYNNI